MAHLVGERLETQRVVGRGQRAGEGFVRALRGLRAQESADGLLEAPLEHAAEAVVGHAARAREPGPRRQVIAVDRGQEKQRADALVEVGLPAAVGLQFGAGGQQFGRRPVRAPALDGEIAHRRRRRLDDVGDAHAHGSAGAGGEKLDELGEHMIAVAAGEG